jgi:DNA mismatch endonuclease (patch repair protein)
MEIVEKATRSRMMAGIRGKDTRPELVVRKLLHGAGFRYRLHVRDLPGKPDIVLPRYRAVIFVHGCFWHVHDRCRFSKLPQSNTEFWSEKLGRNRLRDQVHVEALKTTGWRVLIVWECATRSMANAASLQNSIIDWVVGDQKYEELPHCP